MNEVLKYISNSENFIEEDLKILEKYTNISKIIEKNVEIILILRKKNFQLFHSLE